MKSKKILKESSGLKEITDRYSAEQRTALDGKVWWVYFDNETGKYIPSGKFKTKRECENGIIFAMKKGWLDATPEELEKIESRFAELKKIYMNKLVKENSIYDEEISDAVEEIVRASSELGKWM